MNLEFRIIKLVLLLTFCILNSSFTILFALTTQLSFNSGQLSPLMKYRVDTDKHTMGAEVMENVLVRPEGMAYKRPGTELVDETLVKSNVRLLPFESADDDAYALEFSHESIGFFRTVE